MCHVTPGSGRRAFSSRRCLPSMAINTQEGEQQSLQSRGCWDQTTAALGKAWGSSTTSGQGSCSWSVSGSQVMTTGQQPSYPPSQPFPRGAHTEPPLKIILLRNYCFSLRFLQSAGSRQREGSSPLTSGFTCNISAMWAQKRQLQENPKACTYKCCADTQEGWFWKLVLVPNLSSFHLERSQAAALCHDSLNSSHNMLENWSLGWEWEFSGELSQTN